ncbi:MAG: helix-turn-helix transcriptional regulator [Reyranella sp.]
MSSLPEIDEMRADRLFDVIQVLRAAKKPVTAAQLAEELEVTVRTIYRDVATLQARRVPIEGAPGVGYVLRKGFDLPPLMFTVDEVEAITVGVRLVQRLRDSELQQAAKRVLDKVTVVLPESLRSHVASAPFYVSRGDAVTPKGVDVAQVRSAIRDRRKMRISYVDEKSKRTRRTIWPLAMAYYVDVTLVGA